MTAKPKTPAPDPRKADKGQGIVRDEKGQEPPADKERAQKVSRKDRGDDPPGEKDREASGP